MRFVSGCKAGAASRDKAGYTFISALAIIVLMTSLVVGLNALVSGNLKKSTRLAARTRVELATESGLDLAKAAILQRISRPATSQHLMSFNGSRISCRLSETTKTVIQVQDVAGLVDLRIVTDPVFLRLVDSTGKYSLNSLSAAKVRELALAGIYPSARDVLIAAGFSLNSAAFLEKYYTLHSGKSRLAREVTPSALMRVFPEANSEVGSNLFGSAPSNRTYKVTVSSISGRNIYYRIDETISLDTSRPGFFRTLFRRSSTAPIAGSDIGLSQGQDIQILGFPACRA